MKIAMIGQKGIPAIYGGIERHVEELSYELARQGHTVLVYARKWYAPNPVSRHPNVKIILTPAFHTKHWDAITHTLTSTIHALFQKPDVIHYHGVGPSLLSWIPRLFSRRIKVFSTFHCIDRYHQKWGFAARIFLWLGERASCRFANQTIAVSKTIQNYCLNEFQKTVEYIPNGVAVTDIPAVNNLSAWKLQPNKYLLMVSRLVKHKGAHYLLEAWKFARAQYPSLLNDYKLVIVGGGAFTDDYVQELHEIAGADNNIIFTGWQTGQPLEALYAHAALLVHPSENEGLPITVLQAMSYGRPVLVSDIPEHQEVVSDSRFWFANTSISSLADQIVNLIKDEALLKEAGEKNKKTVQEQYQWKDIGKKTLGLYSALVSKRLRLMNFKTSRI